MRASSIVAERRSSCRRPPNLARSLALRGASRVAVLCHTRIVAHAASHERADEDAQHTMEVLYHGVLSANAAWRAHVVAYGRPVSAPDREAGASDVHAPTEQMPHLRRQRAELLRRGFGMDVRTHPNCGGRLRLVALIMDRSSVMKLLRHAKLPAVPPPGIFSPSFCLPRAWSGYVEGTTAQFAWSLTWSLSSLTRSLTATTAAEGS